MPDLSDHYKSDFLNCQVFSAICKERNRDPFKQGLSLTISGVDLVEMFDTGKKRGTKSEWVAYFYEIDRAGLVIGRAHFNQLRDLIGPDSDQWVHERILLHLVELSQSKTGIRVAAKRLPNAMSPMGEKMVAPLLDRAKGMDIDIAAFEKFAQTEHPRTHELMAGKPPAMWPILAGIHLAAFLKNPPRSPVPPKPGDRTRQPDPGSVGGALGVTAEEMDIPF